jgi:hypothetical protein
LNLTVFVALRPFLVKNAGYLGVSYPFKDAAREPGGGKTTFSIPQKGSSTASNVTPASASELQIKVRKT